MLEKQAWKFRALWTRVHLLYEGGGGTRVKPFGNFLRVVKQKLYRNVAQLVRAMVL